MSNKKLPDTDQWINRVEIRSETSNRLYVVAQNRAKRHWACSCPSFKVRRRCKHLDALGLPGGEVPYELPPPKAAKKSFTDGYKTYDPQSEGAGDPSQWREEFQGTAQEAGNKTPRKRKVIVKPVPARRIILAD